MSRSCRPSWPTCGTSLDYINARLNGKAFQAPGIPCCFVAKARLTGAGLRCVYGRG